MYQFPRALLDRLSGMTSNRYPWICIFTEKNSTMISLSRNLQATILRFTTVSARKPLSFRWRGYQSLDGTGEVSRMDVSNTPIRPLLRSVSRDRIPVVGYLENRNKTEVHSMMILPTFLAKYFLVRYFDETKNLAEINLLNIESYSKVKNCL